MSMLRKQSIYLFLFWVVNHFATANNPLTAQNMDMMMAEQDLIQVSPLIIAGENDSAKFAAAEWVAEKLAELLLKKTSFDYPFDLLKHTTVAIASAPKCNVRIFSFNVIRESGTFYHYGFIQRKTRKGIQVFALRDSLDAAPKDFSEATISYPEWYGALYYQLIPISKPYKNHYIVLGFDGHNIHSNRSVMDVLYFENNEPQWGKPLFRESIEDPTPEVRWSWEYHKGAKLVLRYLAEKNIIVCDELGPSYPAAKGNPYYYIPTGDYSIFKPNKSGFWVMAPSDLTDFGQEEKPNVLLPERPMPTEPPEEYKDPKNLFRPDPNSPDGD